jgi:hypothetical protein
VFIDGDSLSEYDKDGLETAPQEAILTSNDSGLPTETSRQKQTDCRFVIFFAHNI